MHSLTTCNRYLEIAHVNHQTYIYFNAGITAYLNSDVDRWRQGIYNFTAAIKICTQINRTWKNVFLKTCLSVLRLW